MKTWDKITCSFIILSILMNLDLYITYYALTLGYPELNPYALKYGLAARIVLTTLPFIFYRITRNVPDTKYAKSILFILVTSDVIAAVFLVCRNMLIAFGHYQI